jgi:serine/threonine-protein kinase
MCAQPANSQGPPSLGDVLPETTDQSFGKYHVFATLGRGGMADVYLAVARGPVGFNKLVVLKRLRAALADEPAFREMFLDEARLAARLNHPNVVDTFEVGDHHGNYYIAMEYLEGQALNKILRAAIKQRLPLTPQMCARIAADALAGLHAAHTLTDYDGSPLGIIHRDVSPHNLFVRYEGHVKLVDFGIAKAASGSTETEVGVLKGKVAYMAPEQASGEGIDARADLFAMGVVLWEMITLKRLFPGENAAATLHKLLTDPIPLPSEVVEGVSPELDRIVSKSLERDPNRRFQSAAEMRHALEEYIVHAGGARSDDLGRFVSHLFVKLREDTQNKIRAYMTRFNKAGSTQEVRALTAESLRRVEAATAPGMLSSGGGTGSQIGPVTGSMGPPRKNSSLLVPVLVGGSFFVGGILLLLFGLRSQLHPDRPEVVAAASIDPAWVAPPPSAAPVVIAPPPVPSVAAIDPRTLPSEEQAGHKIPHKPSKGTDKPAEPAAPANNSAEPGYLTLETYPWTKVTEGGRTLGNTPLVRVPLPPGTHTLKLENAEQDINKQLTVVIKSGEPTSKRIAIK